MTWRLVRGDAPQWHSLAEEQEHGCESDVPVATAASSTCWSATLWAIMATDPIDPGAARHSAAVGPVVIDVLLGFPAAPDPWWHDGTIAPALFETLRSHHLWFGFDRAGRAGAELTPMGRDELGAGEMWNCNSVIAWVLAKSGLDVAEIRPPVHGRAPGWNAGLQVAARGRAV